jgi:MoaD family protein
VLFYQYGRLWFLRINIKLSTTLKEAAGASQVTVELEGDTVGDVIDALIIRYGDKFRQELLKRDGNIKPTVKVLLNGAFGSSTAPLRDVVKEGDTLSFLPAMFGG